MSKTFVPLTLITDSPYQARIDTGDTEALAKTILEHGLRQLPEARLLVDGEQPGSFSAHTEPQEFPAPVRSAYAVPEKGSYDAQLASGHRRAQAVQLLNDDDTVPDSALEEIGLPPGFIPVDLQRLSDQKMLDVGTIENVQREWLSPIEEARGIRDHAEMGRTNDEIGEIFGGRSASWVSSRKGLLELPKKVQMAVHEERISVRQAQALRDAYALQEEYPEATGTGTIHDPDGLFQSAKTGTKQSDDIRREVKRWEREITADDDEEFSPDVGTTHPQARGPARGDDETEADQDDLPAGWTWREEGPAKSNGPWSFQATRKAEEVEGTDVFFRAHGVDREECISHAKSFDALEEGDFARLTGFNLPDSAVWCSSRIKDGRPVWCVHARGLGEHITTSEHHRSLEYVVQRAWDSVDEPTPEPTELPEDWEWRESCAEATVHDDQEPGPSAVRHWGTANGAPVRSRVSAGQKEKMIERAHKHEHNLSWAFLRTKLDGASKPSLPDGWAWEVTVFRDGEPRISPFRYKGEPTCPAGWSANADGEDIYEKAKEAIRIEENIQSDDDDPDRDREETAADSLDSSGKGEAKDSSPSESQDGAADHATAADEGKAESSTTQELTGAPSGDGAPSTASDSKDQLPVNWPAIRSTAISILESELEAKPLAKEMAERLTDEYATSPQPIAVNFIDHVLLPEAKKSDEERFEYLKSWFAQFEWAYMLPAAEYEVDDTGSEESLVELPVALTLLTCDFDEIEQHLWDASLPTAAAAYRCADASARKSRIRQRFEDEGVSDPQAWYEQEATEEQRDAIDIACSRLKRRDAEEEGAGEDQDEPDDPAAEEPGPEEGEPEGTADVGEVEPTLIEHLLTTGPDILEGSHALESASIASLYVAHQVAQERGEEDREAVMAGEYTSRNVQIDPDDIPAETWDAIEAEIEDYDTGSEGQIADIDVGLNAETVRALVEGAPAIRDSDEVPTPALVVASWIKEDAHALEQRVRQRTGKTNVAVVYAEMDETVQEEMQAVNERVVQDLQTEGSPA